MVSIDARNTSGPSDDVPLGAEALVLPTVDWVVDAAISGETLWGRAICAPFTSYTLRVIRSMVSA